MCEFRSICHLSDECANLLILANQEEAFWHLHCGELKHMSVLYTTVLFRICNLITMSSFFILKI
jgi:hypothetical protein